MIDAVTVTLSILAAVLLRRPLLTNPDADGGVREVGEENGNTVLVPIPVRVKSPHPTGTVRHRR